MKEKQEIDDAQLNNKNKKIELRSGSVATSSASNRSTHEVCTLSFPWLLRLVFKHLCCINRVVFDSLITYNVSIKSRRTQRGAPRASTQSVDPCARLPTSTKEPESFLTSSYMIEMMHFS